MEHKINKYRVVEENGRQRFECLLCHRKLSSRRIVLYHLNSAHKMSPVQKQYKKYEMDGSIDIPKSTAYYRKRKLQFSDSRVPEDEASRLVNTDMSENLSKSSSCLYSDDKELNENMTVDETENGQTCTHFENCDSVSTNEAAEDQDDWRKSDSSSTTTNDADSYSEIFDTDDSDTESEGLGTNSDSASSDQFDDSCSSNYSDITGSAPSKARLNILSCFIRNNLPATACKDILSTFKRCFPYDVALKEIKYEALWAVLDSDYANEIHYCEKCGELFPNDPEIFSCVKPGCDGIRYLGPNQHIVGKPRASFVLANIKKQLTNLLQAPGIWDNIKLNKALRQRRKVEMPNLITDITDGAFYKELEDNFLLNENNLTAIFNTDGMCLYSSSHIQLWPLYIALNELSPAVRFARENMIIAGIWQGKGKPNMGTYLKAFASTLNELYDTGLNVNVDLETVCVKLSVICGTADLPAKAAVLNMKQYNGSDSCITCEDPGKTVKQGKGYSRYFPFREEQEKSSLRTEARVRQQMTQSTERHPVKGFKGLSGLTELKGFPLVKGMVPDYMHCVLLGVTKLLLSKWFSPVNAKEGYFVGNKLNEISARLKSIQPPECMQRLPRDMEKNYSSLKATELQAWLLYYGLPCLKGILPQLYLDHFALLSEGIYLLLGDSITFHELQRADVLLQKFHSQFPALYGEGSCGLNIHNIGCHMVYYVKLFGPLWSWSCFPFEDINSMVTKTVHGTGNVTKQIMKLKQAQSLLRNHLQLESNDKTWKKLQEAQNCQLAGTISVLHEDTYTPVVLNNFNVESVFHIRKALRIVRNGKRFYSRSYNRMQKKNCYTVLTKTGEVVVVLYYVFHPDVKEVFAVTLTVETNDNYLVNDSGKHLVPGKIGNECQLFSAQNLDENIWFINVSGGNCIIARPPNIHGHAVFK